MDWVEIENDKEKYAAYLCSREWAERREAVCKRARGICERCHILPMDACHHLTYERKYNEPLEDLQATCDPCHQFTHGKSDFDPEKNYSLISYFQECAKSGLPAAPLEVLLGDKWSLDFSTKYSPAMYAIETLHRESANLMQMQPLVADADRLYGVVVRFGSIAVGIERSEKLPFHYSNAVKWRLIGKHNASLYQSVAKLVGAEFANLEDYC